MSDARAGRALTPAGGRATSPRWLPVATALAAVVFSLLAVATVLSIRSSAKRARSATTGSAVAPVAEGKVAERQASSVREYEVLSPHSGLMMPAVAPDGHVWVAEMDTNRLAELDPASGEMREYALPGATTAGAMDVAVDAQGGVWYSEASRGAIAVFETRSHTFSEFSTGDPNSSPNGITVDANGNVWFTELEGAIAELDVHSAHLRQFTIPTQGSAPYSLAIDPHGMIWFTEFGAAKIGRLDPTTGAFQEWSTPTSNSGPAGIAIGADGSVWFSESNASAVAVLAPGAEQVREIPLPARRRPSGLTVAPDGAIWLSDTSGSALTAYDPSKASFKTLTVPTPQAGLFWLALSPNGTLWVSEGNLDANKLASVQLSGGS
jgi:virginiamycin B lyase